MLLAHDHATHHHSPATLTHASSRLVLGAAVNLLYVVVEAGCGFYFNSLALVADAGHNLSDVAGLLLALLAFWLAKRSPSASFTYGLRKTTVLASLLNAALLLVAIGGIVWESVVRFQHSVPVPGGVVAWVAGAGILVNAGSALLFARERELNLRGAYLHLLADALVSGAVVGGGLLMRYTGWSWVDLVLGLAVAVVLLTSSGRLMLDTVRLTLDGVPAGLDVADVTRRIREVAGVTAVHHVHIWALSTTDAALTAHLVLAPTVAAAAVPAVKAAVRHELEHVGIGHCTLEVEASAEVCPVPSCSAG